MAKASKYIDVCIQPVPKKNVAEYRKTTKLIGQILVKHGALSSRDYVGEDKNAVSVFGKSVKMKKNEVVIYAVAEFKSKKHREQVFTKMMKDPKMKTISFMMDEKRMLMGGFELLVAVD
ncbi:DUF1428 domain-containing protein [Bdellovibrio sp. qaytius]|nr:DUF1428 domain-containing protein [Bdellovibrio sp. qaytius]